MLGKFECTCIYVFCSPWGEEPKFPTSFLKGVHDSQKVKNSYCKRYNSLQDWLLSEKKQGVEQDV